MTLLFATLGVACQQTREDTAKENLLAAEEAQNTEREASSGGEKATVRVPIEAKSGSDLEGTAVLTGVENGVRVAVEVKNAEPGQHGFHIHQKGDCSAADATSAGGHFSPRDHEHGLPTEDTHHLGDLGNLTVGDDGQGTKLIVAEGANLEEGSERSFLGRAVMIHRNKDDGGQPTGNAGARIGCGEIPQEPEMKMTKAM